MVILVDTGPLVAYLDRGDSAHEFVRSRWEPIAGRFVTTAAVFTEAMHLLRPVQNGAETLVDLFRESSLLLEDVFQFPCSAVQQTSWRVTRTCSWISPMQP